MRLRRYRSTSAAIAAGRVPVAAGRPPMGVTDRHRQGVGGVGAFHLGPGQQGPDHHRHLSFRRVATADDGLLDHVGGVFADRQTRPGRSQKDDAPRQPEPQGRFGVAVDEGLFHRRLMGFELRDHPGDTFEQLDQPVGDVERRVGTHRTTADVTQTVVLHIDDPPAGRPQTRVESQQSHLGQTSPT